MTEIYVIEDFQGDQLEIRTKFDLHHASFCGINVLSDREGMGGLPLVWSGDMLNVDGVRYCISRQVREENVAGRYVALTSLGGTAKVASLEAWRLGSIKQSGY